MPTPPPIPPPQHHEPTTITTTGLKVVIPTAAIAILALAITPELAYLVVSKGAPLEAATAPETPPAWSVGIQGPVLGSLATTALSELPTAIQSQRVPPCDPDLERPIRGACWVPVDVSPCPKGKAFVHDKGSDADGKCYARAMKAARSPTSGDPRNAGVADP